MIEVRDRNDQPVAGATVNFAIRAGRATFSGARTLTVTTNAAGRAAAAGFAPSGTGALQIGATATFQGQAAAAVTIAQTNVMTAAEAAAASTATASGASGAGGGAGMSLTTIGIVGGAVAAGAVVAKQVTGPDGTLYAGDFSAVMPETEVAVPAEQNYSCARTQNQNGNLKMTFDALDSPLHGVVEIKIHARVNQGNCNFTSYDTDLAPAGGTAGGSRDNLSFTIHNTNSFTSTTDVTGTANITEDYAFTGHFDDDNQISGTMTLDRTVIFRGPRYSSDSHGFVTFPVTLRKQ